MDSYQPSHRMLGPFAELEVAQAEKRRHDSRVALSDERLFAAATRLINDAGCAKMTLKDVSRLAGYSRTLASYRFKTKDALFNELLFRFNGWWYQEIRDFVGDSLGLQAFRRGIRATAHLLHRHPDHVRATYILYFELVGSQAIDRERLSVHLDSYRSMVISWIEDGIARGEIRRSIDAEKIVMHFMSFVYGLVYMSMTCPKVSIPQMLEDFEETIASVLIDRDQSGSSQLPLPTKNFSRVSAPNGATLS